MTVVALYEHRPCGSPLSLTLPRKGREPIRWYVPNSLNESERKHDTG